MFLEREKFLQSCHVGLGPHTAQREQSDGLRSGNLGGRFLWMIINHDMVADRCRRVCFLLNLGTSHPSWQPRLHIFISTHTRHLICGILNARCVEIMAGDVSSSMARRPRPLEDVVPSLSNVAGAGDRALSRLILPFSESTCSKKCMQLMYYVVVFEIKS